MGQSHYGGGSTPQVEDQWLLTLVKARTVPGFLGADKRSVRSHGFSFKSCIVVRLGFCGWDVSYGLEEAAVVEPVDPFESCVFDGLEAAQ